MVDLIHRGVQSDPPILTLQEAAEVLHSAPSLSRLDQMAFYLGSLPRELLLATEGLRWEWASRPGAAEISPEQTLQDVAPWDFAARFYRGDVTGIESDGQPIIDFWTVTEEIEHDRWAGAELAERLANHADMTEDIKARMWLAGASPEKEHTLSASPLTSLLFLGFAEVNFAEVKIWQAEAETGVSSRQLWERVSSNEATKGYLQRMASILRRSQHDSEHPGFEEAMSWIEARIEEADP